MEANAVVVLPVDSVDNPAADDLDSVPGNQVKETAWAEVAAVDSAAEEVEAPPKMEAARDRVAREP